jgi:hypothetical protein
LESVAQPDRMSKPGPKQARKAKNITRRIGHPSLYFKNRT